jgi:hypothetical protein
MANLLFIKRIVRVFQPYTAIRGRVCKYVRQRPFVLRELLAMTFVYTQARLVDPTKQ